MNHHFKIPIETEVSVIIISQYNHTIDCDQHCTINGVIL